VLKNVFIKNAQGTKTTGEKFQKAKKATILRVIFFGTSCEII